MKDQIQRVNFITKVLISFCSEMHDMGMCSYSETMRSKDFFQFFENAKNLSENTVKLGVLNQIFGFEKKVPVRKVRKTVVT